MAGLDGAGVRAVLVGTGSHVIDSPLPNVAQVEPTVRVLADCLVEACGVRPENLATLVDPDDPAMVLRAVSDASRSATDVLLIYYVGHGVINTAGVLHLATRATVNLAHLPTLQAVAYPDIVAELASCRARMVVVVLDCCYSARAVNPVASGALLASADRNELALVVDGEPYTAFSGELITALRDGISTAPAGLSLEQLHDHLSRTMKAKRRPQPWLNIGNRTSKLVLAPNRAYQPDLTARRDGAELSDGACPYRGLDAFTAEDAEVFHGRGGLVEQVMVWLGQRARTGGITVVTGPSGSGKSSLLAAGVLPAIRHGDLAIHHSSHWPTLLITPGEDPLSALAIALSEHTPGTDAAAIRAELGEHPDQARAAFTRAAGTVGRVVVVVDQFEELFAPTVAHTDRRAFLTALHTTGHPTADQEPAALVILGLRSDFHGPCARHPELVAALQDHQVVVGPMTTTELRAAITEPAQHAGLRAESGLVDRLLADTGADPDDDTNADYDPGALPLLSYALLATWQHRHGNRLTLDGYRQTGGVTGAITTTAEDTYNTLDDAERREADILLPRMVNVGEDTPHDTRRPLPRSEPEDPITTRVLEAFATARLITLDRGTANLTHEALIRAWPRLHDLINTDRADRQAIQKLETDAHTWADTHDDSLLYRGPRLTAINPDRPDLTPTARRFLTNSHHNEQRTSRNRRRRFAAVSALALGAIAAAILAYLQRDAAQQSRDDAIVNQILAEADRLPDVSLAAQLYLTAHDLRPNNPDVRTALTATSTMALSTPLAGNTDSVFAVAFSPDGRTLATSGDDGTVRLWNTSDPSRPTLLGQPLAGHTGIVRGAAFTSDGRTLATGGDDGTVRLWNTTDPSHSTSLGQPLTGHTGAVSSVAFSPDGHTLATARFDGTVRLWNTTDPAHPTLLGQPLAGHSGAVYSVAFTLDGRTLATGGYDGTVRLWNTSDPSRPTLLGQPLTGNTDSVFAVAFTSDGRTLATAAGNGTVRLWNTTDPSRPTLLGQPLAGHTGIVRGAAFTSDGRTLATGGDDGTVRLWNTTDPSHSTLLGQPLTGHTGAVSSVAFTPDGHTLATAGSDRTVRLWNTPPAVLTGHARSVLAVAFTSDGRTLATGGYDGTVRLWNTTDPTHPTSLGQPLTGHTNAVTSVAFTPDGHTLATAGSDRTVRLWNTTDPTHPTLLAEPLAGDTGIAVVAFTSNGRTLATGGYDGTVRLWNTTDPSHPTLLGQPLAGHSGAVYSVAFTPDGRTLATGGYDGTVRLWNTSDPSHPTLLGQPLTDHTNSVFAVAFTSDGRTLASAGADQTVRLWNTSDPSHPTLLGQPLTGHTANIRGVAITSDGRTLATAGADQTVRLWNTTDPTHPIPVDQPLTGHTDSVYSVAFTPDGRTLATADANGTVRLWDMDSDRSAQRICAATANTLTREKWEKYVSPELPYRPHCP